MRKIFIKYFIIFGIIILAFCIYLSSVGIVTNSFNQQIKDKVKDSNKNLNIDLRKIKFRLDILNFKINARTVGTRILFGNRSLPLKYIESQISLSSFLKRKLISSNIKIVTENILLKDLIRFVRVTNNKPELFFLEKLTKKGHINLDLILKIDDNGNIKNDYEIRGLVNHAEIDFLNKKKIEDLNFEFIIKENSYLFNQIKFKLEAVNFISEKINVKKEKHNYRLIGNIKNNKSSIDKDLLKLLNLYNENINIKEVKFLSNNTFSLEIDNQFKIKDFLLDSNIEINNLKYKKPDEITEYFPDINNFISLKNHKLNLKYKNNNLTIKGQGDIQLEKSVDNIKYLVKKKNNDLNVNVELFLETLNLNKKNFLQNYFPKTNDKIKFNDQKINILYKNKNLSFSGSGKFKMDQSFEEITYLFDEKENFINFHTEFKLENTDFKIDNLNYKKKAENEIRLKLEGKLNNKNEIKIKNLNIVEANNKISVSNLVLNNMNQIVRIDEAKFNYLDHYNFENNFVIKKVNNQNYKITGISFNANTLISNLLENEDKKNNFFFEKNTSVDINIRKVFLDEIYLINNLKGKLFIKNNKVYQTKLKAFYDTTHKIKLNINTNDQGEKVTTLFSSKAAPLVSRYKFIKGFKDSKEGYLDFYSLKKNGVSNSKLIIDNFKVKEIPALAKLLALASLQGIADLLTGEGIRFTDFEMVFRNEDKTMTIEEIYAIGPAISILMNGYIVEDDLISLRGTLVPATTINRSIASIPLIGDLLVGKKIGEGVFGVSFKIKGPPKNLETSVNPIKTLTPRFITRTLEKIKKN